MSDGGAPTCRSGQQASAADGPRRRRPAVLPKLPFALRRSLAAMSWEAVADELEGLLAARCEHVLPARDAAILARDDSGFCEAVNCCGTLPPPSSQERSRLIRCEIQQCLM